MRRLSLAALVLLWSCHQTSASQPATSLVAAERRQIENPFAKGEQSSSFATQMLQSCADELDEAEKTRPPRKATKPHAKAWYCVCMADALGVLKTPTVSAEQASKRCLEFARRTAPKTPIHARTPFAGNRFFSVGQMADALIGCRAALEEKAKTQGLDELQKETFCSCIIDSMRYRRTASTNVPLAETRVCAEAAGWSWQ